MVTTIFWAVAASIPITLWLLGRGKQPPAGTLRYSTDSLLLTWLMGLGAPVALTLALVSGKGMPVSRIPELAPFYIFTMVLASPLLIEFTRVRHQFDDAHLDFRSPRSAWRTLRWDQVTSVAFRPSFQWLDLRDATGAVFHFSTMLKGRGAFASTALRQIPSAVLARDEGGRSALERMIAEDTGIV